MGRAKKNGMKSDGVRKSGKEKDRTKSDGIRKSEKKKDARKISRTRAVKNNVYALKLLNQMCKGRVVHNGVMQFLSYFQWIFYSAFFMRYIVKALSEERAFGEIMAFLVITTVVEGAMSIYDNYCQGKVMPLTDTVVFKRLNEKLYHKAGNTDLKCFEDSEFYNRYTLAITGASERLCETVRSLWGILFGAFAAVIVFVIMFQIDPYAMGFVILPVIGNFVFGRLLNQLRYDRDKAMAPYNRRIDYVNRVVYLADYAKEMRLTNVFRMMKRKYGEAVADIKRTADRYTLKGVILHWFYVNFTFTFIFEGVLLYGAYRTMVVGSMDLSQLTVLSSVMVSATWILIGFTENVVASMQNGLFIENLRTFLEYEPEIPEDYDGITPEGEISSIEFRDVSFAYKKGKPVISHLSFKLEGKRSYALVGHNGAGKSTIIKLLFRLYDPDEGVILLNGRDVKDYNLRAYRGLFAAAFQDYKIFAMSVKENVLMRKATPEDEDGVRDALTKAGVYDKVMSLDKGMDAILTKEFEDDGEVLSGGQYQKIVVARAFAKDSPIKVFDEPSSALDPIAEYELFESILDDSQGKLTLFISHRLSSVKNANKVMMLEQGRVLEEGTHQELMERGGSYANMYSKQAKNYLT